MRKSGVLEDTPHDVPRALVGDPLGWGRF